MTTVYEAAGGWDGVLGLARAWHERVLADEIVEHAFSHGYRPDHTERLAAYWAEAWGGPPMWTDLGEDETTVARIHACNGPHPEMDANAIACFDQAVVDVGLDRDPRLAESLRQYWRWAIASMDQFNAPDAVVPDGLPIPKWGWDGPVS